MVTKIFLTLRKSDLLSCFAFFVPFPILFVRDRSAWRQDGPRAGVVDPQFRYFRWNLLGNMSCLISSKVHRYTLALLALGRVQWILFIWSSFLPPPSTPDTLLFVKSCRKLSLNLSSFIRYSDIQQIENFALWLCRYETRKIDWTNLTTFLITFISLFS